MFYARIQFNNYNGFMEAMKRVHSHSFNVNTIHNLVYSIFPRKDENESKAKLSSFDAEEIFNDENMNGCIYIASKEKPENPQINGVNFDIIEKDENSIEENMKFNINVNICCSKQKNGKEFPIKNVDDAYKFIIEKFEKNGMKVINCNIENFYKKEVDGKKNHCANVAKCNAYIEVTDKEKFKQALITGLGRQTTYGLGMIKLF